MRFALVVLAVLLAPRIAAADGLAGAWSGTIDAPGHKLDLTVRFADDGSATMDIPAQASGLAVHNVQLTGKDVAFELTNAGAKFTGTLDGDAIVGTMTQHGQTVPFTLRRTSAATDNYQPPAPPRRPLGERAGRQLVGHWEGELVAGSSPPAAFALELAVANGLVVGTGGETRRCGASRAIEHLALTFQHVQLELAHKDGAPSYLDATLDGNTLSGTLHGGGVALTVSLHRTAAVERPYRETELAIPSTKGATLAATLTTPPGAPAPVVVLVTGSGPQDRDECVVGVRAFRQLADHLARHGIATLRYDDRGFASSTGDFASSTAADFADDAEAAVRFLAERSDVDPRHIGILGHSEGGLIAPMVAARNPQVAFIVLWAGPGLPLPDVLVQQQVEIAEAEGKPATAAVRNIALQKQLWHLIETIPDHDKLKARLAATLGPRLTAGERAEIGDLGKWIDVRLDEVSSPWFRWYLHYDPSATLRKVHCPVLALNGSLDRQVNAKQNLPVIRTALSAGGNKDISIVELPGLNHLFQPTKTGAVSEYGKNSPLVDAAVLEATTSWLRTHTQLE